jgi:hypothetical protein
MSHLFGLLSIQKFCHLSRFCCPIEDLTDENWGVPPDSIDDLDGYQNHLSIQVNLMYIIIIQIFKWEKKTSNWSVVHMMTSCIFFPGVGGYLRSEMLHRLWKHWNIEPWILCGKLSITDNLPSYLEFLEY